MTEEETLEEELKILIGVIDTHPAEISDDYLDAFQEAGNMSFWAWLEELKEKVGYES